MRRINTYILIFMFLFLTVGCHTGKSITEHKHSGRVISEADSIKYAKAKAAFLSGEFIYRMGQIGSTLVNPEENWIQVSKGKIIYQIFSSYHTPSCGVWEPVGSEPYLGGGNLNGLTPKSSLPYKIKKKKMTYNKKTGAITVYLEGKYSSKCFYIYLTLYKDSNKAYDQDSNGWIEPIEWLR